MEVEISAEGEVGLPGLAATKLGSKSSLTLKLKRTHGAVE